MGRGRRIPFSIWNPCAPHPEPARHHGSSPSNAIITTLIIGTKGTNTQPSMPAHASRKGTLTSTIDSSSPSISRVTWKTPFPTPTRTTSYTSLLPSTAMIALFVEIDDRDTQLSTPVPHSHPFPTPR
ncbi:hypothetical protein Moror_15026 [Moniliophthora roreri MCA 2997]|uniref:Uncharacterized protein n=1 Tax=Moniliophthora roreri (strain MCA 2997) TaxID=1381753 RepID=V2XUS8_MONRO|nr:hypothetical protein Moror_15026 [Moniliophthora roreri MCA 2997]